MAANKRYNHKVNDVVLYKDYLHRLNYGVIDEVDKRGQVCSIIDARRKKMNVYWNAISKHYHLSDRALNGN